MPSSDSVLVGRVLSGDGTAYEELVRRHHGRIYAIAYGTLRNSADAEDAAQEAFIHAYSGLGKLKAAEKFGPWAAKIALFSAKNIQRKRPRKEVPLEELTVAGAIETPVKEAIKNERALDKVIASVMAELPEDIQGVVALRFMQNLSYREIAEYLELPESTVRGALYRGTRYMRKRLTPYLA
jgi:RNA polymerase sigma-70 factor (ECF subfamily)